jgi:hypothetical protein
MGNRLIFKRAEKGRREVWSGGPKQKKKMD